MLVCNLASFSNFIWCRQKTPKTVVPVLNCNPPGWVARSTLYSCHVSFHHFNNGSTGKEETPPLPLIPRVLANKRFSTEGQFMLSWRGVCFGTRQIKGRSALEIKYLLLCRISAFYIGRCYVGVFLRRVWHIELWSGSPSVICLSNA